jgi:ethanolamine ammonia-lyase small subunit
MQTTFHYDTASELNTDFLKAIKTLFKNQKIIVTVESEMDTTEYLLRNDTNRKFLEKSIKQVAKGEVVKIKLEDL